MGLGIPNLAELISAVPADDQKGILGQLAAPDFPGKLFGMLGADVSLAKQLLPLAQAFSQAPVSGFHVGAVAIGATGQFYLGANMEFVGVPLSASLHAEQSAILNAWMHGETRLTDLVVSEAPCGHCRQFLWELPLAKQLAIHFKGEVTDLPTLLPLAFGDARGEGAGLLDLPALQLEPIRRAEGVLVERAMNAARHSYTPYTDAPEGFALECINGAVFAGRTAESVAYNPTVPAIVSALNQRNLSTSRHDAISACVHAKLVTSLASQGDFSKSVLRRLSHVPIETVLMESI
ncbi:MAG: cytidine deaminase [Opitutaceae bacterium]